MAGVEQGIPNYRGGSDDISNLQPLQWENTTHRKDGIIQCKIISSGTENTKQENY